MRLSCAIHRKGFNILWLHQTTKVDTVIISERILCKDNPVAKLIKGFSWTKEEEEKNGWAAKKDRLVGSLSDKVGQQTRSKILYIIAILLLFWGVLRNRTKKKNGRKLYYHTPRSCSWNLKQLTSSQTWGNENQSSDTTDSHKFDST